jgi:hypothetical protein
MTACIYTVEKSNIFWQVNQKEKNEYKSNDNSGQSLYT